MEEPRLSGASALEPSLEAPAAPDADGRSRCAPPEPPEGDPHALARHRLASLDGAARARRRARPRSRGRARRRLPALLFGVEITSSHTPARALDRRHVRTGHRVRARRRASARTSAGARCARGSSGCARRRSAGAAALTMIVAAARGVPVRQRHLVGSLQPQPKRSCSNSSAPTKARCCSC